MARSMRGRPPRRTVSERMTSHSRCSARLAGLRRVTRRRLLQKLPHKIDIGAVFSAAPRDHKKFKLFEPRQREFLIDSDVTDYECLDRDVEATQRLNRTSALDSMDVSSMVNSRGLPGGTTPSYSSYCMRSSASGDWSGQSRSAICNPWGAAGRRVSARRRHERAARAGTAGRAAAWERDLTLRTLGYSTDNGV